ncbi:hypothetical protein F4781DRAFT_386700 [Annulohypoxylon bovei var. microspora]|nr:hypothetical protein F4781DRAFT_386700 [Annulohypoxylon bovei var. microspora]
MEAVAVVGLISNVLQFVDLGYKLLSKSKEIYVAGNEEIRSNKDLRFMTQEMKRLSQSLAKGGPMSHITHDEQALLRLAAECERWSDDMLAFLAHLKNPNPESKLAAFKTSVRNYSSRHERSRLENGLNNCRMQLNLQLSSMSRSDILQRLDSLSTSSKLTIEDITSLKCSAESLQQSLPDLAMNISSQFLDQLRDILRTSGNATLKAKQKAFLDTLIYEGMEDRFYHVEPAHAATFRWLLEDNPAPDGDRPTNKNPARDDIKQEIRDRFTNWLRNESGIFHISGKPGAGKSTLMKFLCESELTRHYLEDWSKDRTLIFAKAFFWRLGNNTQNFISLIRSLLYQVLSAAPDMIPSAFPSRWVQIDSLGNTVVQLELGEIEQGFHNLLMNQATFESHKIVFFIDGLDEYKGRHIELVKKLFSWASSNLGNLKICVSSREWNEFMVGFSECPKLRIHDYTHEDISILARDQLKVGSHYPRLVNDIATMFISQKIAYKAEGVFQWVRLVLNAVEDGILNGDNASELESKIDAFPNELGDLYQHLFDSIHVRDRQKVFETLRMTNHMGLDHGLPLIRFWFLNKVVDDPNYAIEMKLGDESDEEIREILEITRRQIYGRCKGFLIMHNYSGGYSSRAFSPPFPNDGEIRFMHSTAYEFLEQLHIKQAIDRVVGHVDVFDRICQTFLAHVKFARPEWYDSDPSDSQDSPFNQELSDIFEFALEKAHIFLDCGISKASGPRFVEFLNEVETVLIKKRGSIKSTYKLHNCLYLKPGSISYANIGTSLSTHTDTLIPIFAISWSIHEFFREKDVACLLPAFRRISISDILMCLLFGAIGNRGPRMKLHYERQCKMLEWCFSKGIASPNHVDINALGLPLVDCMLLSLLYRPSYRLWHNETYIHPKTHLYPLRLLELCLRYGARPQLQLYFYGNYEEKHEPFVRVQPVFARRGVHEGWYTPKTSRIAILAGQRKGTITVRDLVELWFPHDYKVLQRLIDRNERVKNPGIDIHTRGGPSYCQGGLERNWSEVELGEDLFQWHTKVGEVGDIIDCEELNLDESFLSPFGMKGRHKIF